MNECRNEEELRARVLADLPGEWEGMNDWERVCGLRQWVHEAVTLADTREVCVDQVPGNQFYGLPVHEALAAFEHDEGGVWCGGTASILRDLCRFFGFGAVNLDVGRADGITHVVTLIPIAYEGRELTNVQDAYLNETYVDTKGAPLDFFDLISHLGAGRRHEISLQPGEARPKGMISMSRAPAKSFSVNSDTKFVKELACGRCKFDTVVTGDRFRNDPRIGRRIETTLAAAGCPPDGVYLLGLPFACYGPGEEALTKRVEALIAALGADAREPDR